MTDTWLVETQEFLFLRLSDAGEYAESIVCTECYTGFSDQIEYLGEGRYLAFCSECDNYESFSNAEVFKFKRDDDHYWMVEELVRYHYENNIELVIASVCGEWVCDGHHRIAAALDLNINMVMVDNRNEPIYDWPNEWAMKSPAFCYINEEIVPVRYYAENKG